MNSELTKAAQAALNACERIVDQEDSPVQFGIDFRALGSSLRRALTQRPAAQEVEISTKHGPWLPSRHHEGETYCERCLTRSVFASSRACDPHIVTAPQQATPEPVAWQERQTEYVSGTFGRWYNCTGPLPRAAMEDGHLSLTTGGITYQWRPLYTRPAAAPAVPEGFDVQALTATGGGHKYPLIVVREKSSQLGEDVFQDEHPVIYGLLSAWLAAAQAKEADHA